ncbi:beta-ketoacyl [acyl carrier protein] synthase domain-containing protein [Streptomyces olivaceoviridis]
MDPQQRLALETAWEALEQAGIDPTSLRQGDAGVFMGVTTLDHIFESTALAPADLDAYLAPGPTHSAVSGRLSYFLGPRGPCMTVDTTCSSSLTAAHPADNILALGGVLAPNGQCKTFDARADGYARAEGCGVLVLKRLSDAQRDGDRPTRRRRVPEDEFRPQWRGRPEWAGSSRRCSSYGRRPSSRT